MECHPIHLPISRLESKEASLAEGFRLTSAEVACAVSWASFSWLAGTFRVLMWFSLEESFQVDVDKWLMVFFSSL